MNKFLLILLVVPLFAISCTKQSGPAAIINGHRINIEIANTDEARAKGLGSRSSLGKNDGMLFVLSTPDRPSFWMKDMQFALDVIWIKDETVIGLTADVQPEPGVKDELLRRYTPTSEVDAVLEVNAGWTEKNGIKIGDSVIITE